MINDPIKVENQIKPTITLKENVDNYTGGREEDKKKIDYKFPEKKSRMRFCWFEMWIRAIWKCIDLILRADGRRRDKRQRERQREQQRREGGVMAVVVVVVVAVRVWKGGGRGGVRWKGGWFIPGVFRRRGRCAKAVMHPAQSRESFFSAASAVIRPFPLLDSFKKKMTSSLLFFFKSSFDAHP